MAANLICPLGRMIALILPLMLGACAEADFDDLDLFMAEQRSQPKGTIEPIPVLDPYEPFAYEAATLRGPFDRPLDARPQDTQLARASVQPDLERVKEYLEQFTLDSLLMVGSLKRGGQDWSLVKDPEGGIHPVQVGSFLGRDHGKIVDMTERYIAVMEIVPDGTKSGWVERPRTLELSGI